MNLNHAGWPAQLLRLVARLRSDGVNSTTPVTEINGGNISATDADIALVVKGAGAILANVPDGTVVGGSKRGQLATDLQKLRTISTRVASGTNSGILSGSNNGATSLGSAVVGGDSNTATNSYAFVGGGTFNTASGFYSAVLGGNSNLATATNSVVAGGSSNVADGTNSCILGGRMGSTRGINGFHVFPACNAPIASASGVSQSGLLVIARETTSASATVLGSTSSAASSNNQIALPSNSAYSFSGEVIAGVTGGGDTARWTINGAIKRGAAAASTALVGTPTVTMTHNDAGAAAWTVAVTADTTNGALAVTVTGAAATTIRWVCRINTTEMTY